jgi:hypothetical protein
MSVNLSNKLVYEFRSSTDNARSSKRNEKQKTDLHEPSQVNSQSLIVSDRPTVAAIESVSIDQSCSVPRHVGQGNNRLRYYRIRRRLHLTTAAIAMVDRITSSTTAIIITMVHSNSNYINNSLDHSHFGRAEIMLMVTMNGETMS